MLRVVGTTVRAAPPSRAPLSVPDRHIPVDAIQIAPGIFRIRSEGYLFAPHAIAAFLRERASDPSRVDELIGELLMEALKAEAR